MKKLFLALLVISMLMCSVAFAAGSAETIFSQGSATLPSGVEDAAGSAFQMIKTGGLIVGGLMLCWAGFKYLTAGAGKKAEAKESILPIVIGSAIIILAPQIIDAIWDMFK